MQVNISEDVWANQLHPVHPVVWILHCSDTLALHHNPHVHASRQLQGEKKTLNYLKSILKINFLCTGSLFTLHHRRVEGEGWTVRGGLGQSGLLQLHHLCWCRHVRHLRHPDLQNQHVPLQEQGQQLLQCVCGRHLQHLHVQHDPHRGPLHHPGLQCLVRRDDQEVWELRWCYWEWYWQSWGDWSQGVLHADVHSSVWSLALLGYLVRILLS